MSVKLGRYIFRRIGGRIIPIRKGLERASKEVNRLVNKALSAPLSKKTGEPSKKLLLGRGVDFNVFGSRNMVLKLQRPRVGTSNKAFLKRYPETADKVALAETVAQNLPNYGIETVPSQSIRVKKGVKGLIQEKVTVFGDAKKAGWARRDRLLFDFKHLSQQTGINFDFHIHNSDADGRMIDTGLALKKSSIRAFEQGYGAEVLGVGDRHTIGMKIKDNMNPSVLSDQALLAGTSKGALKKINALLKSGYKYKRVGSNEYKLLPHKLQNQKMTALNKLHEKINRKK